MNICILGAGAWGTAMALHLDRCGHAVTLVPRRMEHALDLASSRENTDYLPGFKLPRTIQIGAERKPVLMEAEVIVLACPSKVLRNLCRDLAHDLETAWQVNLFVTLCKGLEHASFKTPSEIVGEVFPDLACGALSGPTFAREVAEGKPTAITLALPESFADAGRYQKVFSNEVFRAYLSHDLRGTELGGALKNVYAIASGLCDGLDLGDNAKAGLLTRSLAEMVRIGATLGGRKETFFGLSGFGDLVATCSGDWSRNRTFGERVGRGEKPAAILEGQKAVVEGHRAAGCFKAVCDERGIDAPILSEIHAILENGKEPGEALRGLMSRDLKAE